jgi:uncharacterized protein YyaL (SSP411 family)
MQNPAKYSNHLAGEKSPYLIQHSGNPVDWHPWGDEAFARARSEDKPVFLSIGYSTCHWCHVMERESFEDPDVARLMNETFVSVKVDREERPDIDALYMTVCQMLTGSGGWPLTIVMTPDRKPFFAATYLPRDDRQGLNGIMGVTRRIGDLWRNRRERAVTSAQSVAEALAKATAVRSGRRPGVDALHAAFKRLLETFDPGYGGFGGAPKFPTPHLLTFLLRYYRRTGDGRALQMVQKTLSSMRAGGIYDQIGFGFHRYSTDGEWLVPHFEKMLYDQALVAMAYLAAWQAGAGDENASVVREIFTYTLRDMTSPEGGFYSAEDADSQGAEGSFYLFTLEELERELGAEETGFAAAAYGLSKEGNIPGRFGEENPGKNIFLKAMDSAAGTERFGITTDAYEGRLAEVRKKIFGLRNRRARPHLDDKVLTDWNCLMVSALARGGAALGEPAYVEAAVRAFSFIKNTLVGKDGAVLHRWRDGEAAIDGKLDDYAFLLQAAVDLYEATFEPGYLGTAESVAKNLVSRFQDAEGGGFFLSPAGDPDLISRPRALHDGALPAGNSVAATALLRLSRLTADSGLESAASGAIEAASRGLKEAPTAYTELLGALDFMEGPLQEIVIAGDPGDPVLGRMVHLARSRFLPNSVLMFKPTDRPDPEIVRYAGFLDQYSAVNGKATAYVCVDHSCRLPTTDPEVMLSELGG